MHIKIYGEMLRGYTPNQANYYLKHSLQFCSREIALRVLKRLDEKQRSAVLSFIRLPPDSAGMASHQGSIFEVYGMWKLVYEVDFQVKCLNHPTHQVPRMQVPKYVDFFDSIDDLARKYAADANRQLRPTQKNVCAIDLMLGPMKFGNFTKSKSHVLKLAGTKNPGLTELVNRLGGHGYDGPIEFYWLVPEDVYQALTGPAKFMRGRQVLSDSQAKQDPVAKRVVQYAVLIPTEEILV